MKIIIRVAIILTLFLAGCNKSTEPAGEFSVSSYPLAVGNYWTYGVVDQYTNFRQTVPGFSVDTLPQYSTLGVEIMGKKLLEDSIDTWEFKSTWIVPSPVPDTVVYYGYYGLAGDTLFRYAHRGYVGPQIPKVTVAGPGFERMAPGILEMDVRAMSEHFVPTTPTDSIQMHTRPQKLLVFPLREGGRWISTYDVQGRPWRGKEITGGQSVAVPAGVFAAFGIRHDFYFIQDVEWYEYVGTMGVVRTTSLFRNIAVTSPQYPEGYGYVDARRELSLTSIKNQVSRKRNE